MEPIDTSYGKFSNAYNVYIFSLRIHTKTVETLNYFSYSLRPLSTAANLFIAISEVNKPQDRSKN